MGLHRAPRYAGEVIMEVEVSYICARESAFKIQPSKKTVQL